MLLWTGHCLQDALKLAVRHDAARSRPPWAGAHQGDAQDVAAMHALALHACHGWRLKPKDLYCMVFEVCFFRSMRQGNSACAQERRARRQLRPHFWLRRAASLSGVFLEHLCG